MLLQLSIDSVLRGKKTTKIQQKQTANNCYTVNEHLLWWIQPNLMNTDQCPEAINMFLERDGEPYKGKERESSWAIAKPTEGDTHLRPSATYCGGNSEFTLLSDDRKWGNEGREREEVRGWNKKQIERQGEGEQRDETKGGEKCPQMAGHTVRCVADKAGKLMWLGEE